ncbi:MAG: tRNA (N6-isopentenyl adenosine(37)-C2)-methylthiotransferase MiaB [Bacteroidales bacterium]|nr:tRNA (N6-isopentenyl adenosine(37)-C2)-methylthiotransferase MiaB [Bacteroidales bacterium]
MKVYIETYGCQMNVGDSEVILSILKKNGFTLTTNMDDADLILANTCSIRDNAEQRIWGRVEQFNLVKRRKKDAKVGIVGCMAERLKDELLASGKVDIVCGPDAYRRLPELVGNVGSSEPTIDVQLSRTETYDDIVPERLDSKGVSAFISIMRGCNNVCSYCIVPYTRGVERSREPQSIIDEALDLAGRGYKEITLLGQNVNSYNWNNGELTFPMLMEKVATAVPGVRIRFSTSNPHDLSDDLLHVIAKYPNVCKHIHLPVQSGSNAMLEKMRRKYTREWYLERVAKIREIIPGCGLSTDVIAGFCGETLEDHLQTVSLMDEVGFDSAFMFQYSERPGTLAARKYADDVPNEEKTRRLNEIIEHQVHSSAQRYGAQYGRKLEVLIEGKSKRSDADLCGRASNNMMCVFPDLQPGVDRTGKYATVQVVGSTSATLLCEEIQK